MLSPESAIPKERERQVTATQTEIRFIADDKLMAKLEKLRALMAHHGNLNYAELIEKLADQALKKLDPEQRQKPRPRKSHAPESQLQESRLQESRLPMLNDSQFQKPKPQEPSKPQRAASPPAELPCIENKVELPSTHRPHLRTEDRRAIWQRARGCCEYADPVSGRRCGSKWALEIDHITPLAKGGQNERSNFRLVCRNHNALLAIQAFGLPLMQRYLSTDRLKQ